MEYFPALQYLYRNFQASYLKQVALDSWDDIYFGFHCLSQESMVLSQQLAYLSYPEISLTVLENNRNTAFVNLWLSPLKLQNMKKQQQQNRSLFIRKASSIYLLSMPLVGYIYQDLRSPAPSTPKGNRKFEILLVFQPKTKKQQKMKYFQLL